MIVQEEKSLWYDNGQGIHMVSKMHEENGYNLDVNHLELIVCSTSYTTLS